MAGFASGWSERFVRWMIGPPELRVDRLAEVQAQARRAGLDSQALMRFAKPAVRPEIRRIYEPNPKHGAVDRGRASAAPSRPQWALDHSIEISDTTPRRVAVDPKTKEYLVFDAHEPGRYHGHARSWGGTDGLDPAMQAALRRAGLVGKRGEIK